MWKYFTGKWEKISIAHSAPPMLQCAMAEVDPKSVQLSGVESDILHFNLKFSQGKTHGKHHNFHLGFVWSLSLHMATHFLGHFCLVSVCTPSGQSSWASCSGLLLGSLILRTYFSIFTSSTLFTSRKLISQDNGKLRV